MNLDKLNQWLTLFANVGVFAGLVFLGFEIQQNTRVVERELAISQSDNVNGRIVESDYLAEIMIKIGEVQGVRPVVQEYMDVYDMTEEQAQRWWRYIGQIWDYNEADWVYGGKIRSECLSFLLEFLDHQIYFKHMKSNYLGSEYAECIEEAMQNGT